MRDPECWFVLAYIRTSYAFPEKLVCFYLVEPLGCVTGSVFPFTEIAKKLRAKFLMGP